MLQVKPLLNSCFNKLASVYKPKTLPLHHLGKLTFMNLTVPYVGFTHEAYYKLRAATTQFYLSWAVSEVSHAGIDLFTNTVHAINRKIPKISLRLSFFKCHNIIWRGFIYGRRTVIGEERG